MGKITPYSTFLNLNLPRDVYKRQQKSESRDELVRQARRAMLELVRTMQDSVCDHPDAERLMLELAAQLGACLLYTSRRYTK